MTTNAPARFHWRAFVTLYVTLCFLLLAASGIVLYVAPPGRVANWSRWTLGTLDRSGWQALHTVFALLFVLAGAFHLWFNWRAFWFYVRTRLAEGVRLRREMALAAAALLTVAGLTLADLPPFGSVMDLGERAKESWSSGGGEPKLKGRETPKEIPAGGGFGSKTVGEVCEQLEVPLAEGFARLGARGIEASADTPMKDLAERLGKRPHDLVEILIGV